MDLERRSGERDHGASEGDGSRRDCRVSSQVAGAAAGLHRAAASSTAASITKQEILDFLSGRVAKWWLPDDIVFIEAVPKTSVGKFNKRALREQFKDYSLPS